VDDDGEWFTFDAPDKRAVRIAILPEVVNAWLIERIYAKPLTLGQQRFAGLQFGVRS
jgi:hypothetical protein